MPDLAGWRQERLPVVPDEPFSTLAPDWACEILSPSTESIDRLRKMRVYAREDVTDLWFVNPATRTLEVFGRQQARWLLAAAYGDAEIVRAEPFEAIAIEFARLWAESPQ